MVHSQAVIESPQWSYPRGPDPGGSDAQRWGAVEEICLVEVTDAADQLAHWVAEDVFAENDATRRGFYHSLCGRVLLPASMTVGPRGPCRDCRAIRAELERHAARRHPPRRSPSSALASWAGQAVGLLTRLGARARHGPPSAST